MRSKTSRFLLGLSALSLLMAALVLVPTTRAAQAQSVSIEQTQTGNIFTVGATPTFEVSTSASELTWTAQDYWSAEAASGTEQVSGDTLRLETPIEDPGFYRLRLSVGEAEQLETVETTFAVVPEATPPADDGFVFGMQTHFAQGWNTELVPLLKRAGVESVRDQLTWAEIEATKGEYDFEGKFDNYVKALNDNGIALLANFGISNPNYDNGASPHSEAGQAGYARFVKEVVKHYDTEIEEISVYNEPNLARFGDHGDGPADATPENYFNLLRKTHEAVKQVDPDVTMAGPELMAAQTLSWRWRPWLNTFFELGGLDYVDAVSVHPYRDQCCTPEGMDGDIERLRELIRQHDGGDKPIYITEQGWTTELNSEAEQAAYLPRTYTQARKAGIGRFHWFNLMDNNGKEHGLLHEPGSEFGPYTPKPAFVSYAVMTNQLSGWKFESDNSTEKLRDYTFTKGDSTKRVLWAPEGERTVGLSVNGPVEVTDMMGASRTLEPHGGRVTLTLTDDPLYVTGEVFGIGNYTEFRMQSKGSSASDAVPTKLELDNGSSFWWTGNFEIAGKTYTIETEPGDYIDKHVKVPASGFEGRRAVRAEVDINGKLTGWLSSQVGIEPDVDVRMVPRVGDGGESSVDVEVTNNRRKTEYTFEDFDWKVDDQSGTEQVGRTLAPGATETIPISLAQKDNWVQYPSEITVRLADLPALKESGGIGFNPAAAQSLTVDGDLSELADTPHLELTEHGEVRRADPDVPYEGPKDLSGPVWMTADEDNLYVAAEVTDDVHFNDQTGEAMREEDNFRFALANGVPGETRGTTDYYEYMAALTEPEGPQAIRNRAPVGEYTGPAKHIQLEVKRDEANTKTIYELAIPWDDMKQIGFTDGVVSASLLANDNDGDSRADVEGWIQWGAGINGGKLPFRYRAVDLQGVR